MAVLWLRTLPSAPLVPIYSTQPFLNGWPMGDHHAPGGGVVNYAGDMHVSRGAAGWTDPVYSSLGAFPS